MLGGTLHVHYFICSRSILETVREMQTAAWKYKPLKEIPFILCMIASSNFSLPLTPRVFDCRRIGLSNNCPTILRASKWRCGDEAGYGRGRWQALLVRMVAPAAIWSWCRGARDCRSRGKEIFWLIHLSTFARRLCNSYWPQQKSGVDKNFTQAAQRRVSAFKLGFAIFSCIIFMNME